MDINRFLNFHQLKNGKTKITFDFQNQTNIYHFLRELGFCKSNLDGKRVYYQRVGVKINPVTSQIIKDAFFDFLQKEEFSNIPNGITHSDITNWFLEHPPIKNNGGLDNSLKDTLTESETQSFRLQTDESFKHKFEVKQLISKFEEWNFNETTDYVGAFQVNNPLYYKNIGNKRFIVFNHYNSTDSNNDGFDSWIASFDKEKQIGTKKPNEIQTIQLNFQLKRDFNLIKDFVN
ncbi:MAG: hypothetical protein ACPGSL_05605 [Vicingaceae bacterium]